MSLTVSFSRGLKKSQVTRVTTSLSSIIVHSAVRHKFVHYIADNHFTELVNTLSTRSVVH